MKTNQTEGKGVRIVSQEDNPNHLDVYVGNERIKGVFKVTFNAEAKTLSSAVIHVLKPIIDVNLNKENTVIKELE